MKANKNIASIVLFAFACLALFAEAQTTTVVPSTTVTGVDRFATPVVLPSLPTNWPAPTDTTPQAARIRIQYSSQVMVAQLNADLKARYLSRFADYATNMESGQVVPPDRQVPPQPPMAWELAPADASGLVFYQIGSTPVCAMPPLPFYGAGNSAGPKPANVIHVGHPISGKWYSVEPDDTFPSGMTTPPQPDGHTYQKFGAPVGPGWYLQVS